MNSFQIATIYIAISCFSFLSSAFAAEQSFERRSIDQRFKRIEAERAVDAYGSSGDRLGRSISAGETRIAVSAAGSSDNGYHYNGECFIFDYDDSSDQWSYSARIAPSDSGTMDRFCSEVSLSGNRLLASARRTHLQEDAPGAVFIYEYDGTSWNLQGELTAQGLGPGDGFGTSLAIKDDVAIVSAPWDDDNNENSGAVYVFENDGEMWHQVAKLSALDSSNAYFGFEVLLGEDQIVVSAHRDSQQGVKAGAVYIFAKTDDEWALQQKLVPADESPWHYFGKSIALFENHLAIGADGDGANLQGRGVVYIFEYDGSNWSETTQLQASNVASRGRFGRSVSIRENELLVGAAKTTANKPAAYLFEFDGSEWSEREQFFLNSLNRPIDYSEEIALFNEFALIGAPDEAIYDSNTGSVRAYKLRQNDTEGYLVIPGDSPDHNFFGAAMSQSERWLIVGSPRDDGMGIDAGAAHIYEWKNGTWEETASLRPDDLSSEDYFGLSVSVYGNRAVVGASQQQIGNWRYAGTAYVYDYNGESWVFSTKLLASDLARGAFFGSSVSMGENRILVGAERSLGGADDSGAAYVFDYDVATGAWVESIKLIASDSTRDDRFGRSVSLWQDRALVGAYVKNVNGFFSGAAYIFDYDGTSWNESTRLTPTDSSSNDYFGWSVSLNGDNALVGAFGADNDHFTRTGAAYMFTLGDSGWYQSSRLLPINMRENHGFGYSVSLIQSQALVGSHIEVFDQDSGRAAYLYNYNNSRETWDYAGRIEAPENGSDNFGEAVSLRSDLAIIGAPHYSHEANEAGAMYMYKLSLFSDGFE